MTTNNLTYQFKTANVATKLIVINVILFLVVRIVAFLMGNSPAYVSRWFVLPENVGELILQPWSLVSYSFLHFGFWHILFNMLWLHWFGRIILNLFSPRKFLTIYLLGAICGGLLFVLSYNVFPVFENRQGFLIGASGAVMAIMIFMATYAPNTAIRIFTFNLKLWHIAVFFLLWDLVRLPTSGNAGGLLAHMGGAIFGYAYAVQMAKGNDIGAWFEKLMDRVANLFKSRKQKPFKKVHRTTQGNSKRSSGVGAKDDKQKKVDAILDKIGKSGYDSLTKAEKDFLFKAGKDN